MKKVVPKRVSKKEPLPHFWDAEQPMTEAAFTIMRDCLNLVEQCIGEKGVLDQLFYQLERRLSLYCPYYFDGKVTESEINVIRLLIRHTQESSEWSNTLASRLAFRIIKGIINEDLQ